MAESNRRKSSWLGQSDLCPFKQVVLGGGRGELFLSFFFNFLFVDLQFSSDSSKRRIDWLSNSTKEFLAVCSSGGEWRGWKLLFASRWMCVDKFKIEPDRLGIELRLQWRLILQVSSRSFNRFLPSFKISFRCVYLNSDLTPDNILAISWMSAINHGKH